MFGRKKSGEKKKESIWSLVSVLLIALSIRWAVAEAYVIPSGSMLPTLLLHDHIFVNKMIYGVRVPFSSQWLVKFNEPKRGEIVVFKNPRDGVVMVKRIIGLPGDRVAYDGRTLAINDGTIETEPATSKTNFDWLRDDVVENRLASHDFLTEKLAGANHDVLLDREEGPYENQTYTVPAGHLFMMGDHRDNSADSRVWGFLPIDNILGRASFVWLTCDEPIPVVELFCNPLTMRWGRLGHPVN
ncbi:MAG: signal peptidase I [Bdellovibrionota bacterium]